MKARILWIEGKRADSPSFIPILRKKGYRIETVSSGAEALKRLEDVNPELVVVNAASMRTSGRRICRSLREKMNGVPIVTISAAGESLKGDPCVNVALTLPFTARKLLNRIRPLLPSDDDKVQRVGPICLDMERLRVECDGKEARLTPRVALLLKIMLDNPGEVLEREALFRKLWKTEYTGDTRTLDVHMSWLRRAIEVDPRNPRYIKTVRGVGYRLDI
ncbi:MAG: response regulator transcription factor [Chloroflexi bacterium]|jgi:DNA-binding response OmpR family regulator|nr:response regulator transcription factor [Chloroflexota bacterium]